MNRKFNTAQSIPAFLAVLLLLVASSSHIHLRYCLDGDEAPVSIHFESNDSHPSDVDIADSDQADIESELSLDILLEKSSKTSIDSVAFSNTYLSAVAAKPLTFFLPRANEALPSKPTTLLPPSRAPPVIA